MLEIGTAMLEILIITVMINYLLSFFWNTKSMDLVVGSFFLVIVFLLAYVLHLPVLQKIATAMANVAIIALIVIFQPEIRTALSKLHLKTTRVQEITEFDKFVDQLTNSVYRMAEKQIGALIVLEKTDSLDDLIKKSLPIQADFSSELLETIFAKTTPLHDGAVIIRNKKIAAASVILPLADNPNIQKSMGTRHRAGIGLSSTTDAVVIIVSEELGKVSIARDGVISRGVKMDRFKGVLRSLFYQDDELIGEAPKEKTLWKWFKQ